MPRLSARELYDKVFLKLNKFTRRLWYKKYIKKHYNELRIHNIPLRKLSREQKNQIIKVWGEKHGKDYYTHELIYSITGDFNPYYCSVCLFGTDIEFSLNNKNNTGVWSDKNYFDKFFPNVPFPKTIVRNIHGVFYDNNYNIIDCDTAASIISGYDYVCVKPSLITGNGTKVAKIAVDDKVVDVFKSYGKNYLVQEILSQHQSIKAINESSVNVIRMNTLFLNGKLSVLSSSMRFGAVGSFNDNYQTPDGTGMFVVGISDDGKLKDVGYHACGKSVTVSPNGANFAGVEIPNFEKAKELALSIHSHMPFARLVAFDIAFNSNGEPVIMEYNLMGIGPFYYQLTAGPLFGERTQELIDTMRKEKILY